MFGGLRLLMAVLVALSHYGLQKAGINPGQWSVIGFYVISGYLMEASAGRLVPRGGAMLFYKDRALRIAPLYLLVLLLALPVVHLDGAELLENLLLLPLGYADFTAVPVAIGPAWSLALEVQYYLLVPVVLMLSNAWVKALVAASLAVFAASPWLPHNTFWAYYGLPGMLFTFCSGVLLRRGEFAFLKRVWAVVAVLLVAFSAGKLLAKGLPSGINISVALGYLLCVPTVFALASKSPSVPVDMWLGELAYPLFLVHEVIALYLPQQAAAVKLLASFALAAALAWVVDRRLNAWRHRLRANYPSKPATAEPAPLASGFDPAAGDIASR